MLAYERNNGGLFEMERLAALNRQGKFDVFHMPTYGNATSEDTPRLGWDTNTATRPNMLSDLKEAIDTRIVAVSDRLTIEELYAFVVVQTSSSWKARAESVAHDDLSWPSPSPGSSIRWRRRRRRSTNRPRGGLPRCRSTKGCTIAGYESTDAHIDRQTQAQHRAVHDTRQRLRPYADRRCASPSQLHVCSDKNSNRGATQGRSPALGVMQVWL
jgi:hypothetical protein